MIGSSRIVTCEDASRRRRKSESRSCFITPSEQAFYTAHVPPTRQRKRVESEECGGRSRSPWSLVYLWDRHRARRVSASRLHVTPSDTERASRFLWTRLGSRRRSTEHWRPLSPRGHSPILGWAGESETRKKPRGREWKEWIAVPDRAFHLDAPLCSSFSPFSPLSLSLSSHWADARETRRASRWFRGLGVFLCFILFCSRLSTIVNYCNFVESREIFLRMYMYICVWFSSCQNFVPKYHTWYVLIMRKIWTR